MASLRFNPFTLTLEVRQLALREADESPIAGFALLRVRLSAVSSLLHRAWTFSEVRLQQPSVKLLVYPDGTLNLAKIVPPRSAALPAAAPAALPALRINSLSVLQGQLLYEDRSRGRPFTATLSPIEFSLRDFRTQPRFQNRYRFSAATKADEQLAWSGQFSLRPLGSAGEFALTGLKAATIVAYLENVLPFEMPKGSFDVQGAYRWVASADADLSLTLPSLKVHELAIAPKAQAREGAAATAPWIELPELDIADTSVQLAQRVSSLVR